MSLLESEAAVATPAPARSSRRRSTTRAALTHCLVVAADAQRCRMIAGAAEAGGWEAVVCTDVPSALECLGRMFIQLAVVDLERSGGRVPTQFVATDFHRLAAELAGSSGPLLVICGNSAEGDRDANRAAKSIANDAEALAVETQQAAARRQEELWARQLGPWLYLPGVRAEGLAIACESAQQVVQQLARAAARNVSPEGSSAAAYSSAPLRF